jgi:hypothetical protein
MGGPTGPARPDRAQKWPGPSGQRMLSGRAWAIEFSPIAKSGRAWADKISIFLKARPDGPVVFCSVGSGLGRDLVARQSGRAGPGQLFLRRAFAWPGLTRQHAQVWCSGKRV